MKKALPLVIALAAAIAGIIVRGAGQQGVPPLQFTRDNRLILPTGYREWIYVSSGLGMTYRKADANGSNPTFDNVFVNPQAYGAFRETGKWPDKTIFVLEVRKSSSHASINKGGNFQSELVAIEAEVKDASRFPEQWAYFDFGGEGGAPKETASALPQQACYSCHHANAAVENTFAQFYPTLLPIAIAKGTVNASYKAQARSSRNGE